MSAPPTVAFLLGAGLGTRLKALTARLPKPLIPVCNAPLITRAMDHLRQAGVQRFVINTHWQAEAYPATFPDASWQNCPLSFSHETPEVLETAGGLKFAQHLLPTETSFWVYNGDILSDVPLHKAWEAHQASGNEVTLVLRSQDGPLQVAFDPTSARILDLGRRLLPHLEPRHLFTGIYLVHPAFLHRIPPATKQSVIPIFLEMIRSGARLGGVVLDEGHWWDLGTREQYLAVHAHFAASASASAPASTPILDAGSAPWIHPQARIHPNASLLGATAVGPGALIEANAILEDTVVWANAHILPHTHLRRCVVTAAQPVHAHHTDADL